MWLHVREGNFWTKLILINQEKCVQSLAVTTTWAAAMDSLLQNAKEVHYWSYRCFWDSSCFAIFLKKIPYLEDRPQAWVFIMSMRFFWALPQSAFPFPFTFRDVWFRVVQRWGSWLRSRTCSAEEFLQWDLHKTWEISREIFRDASKSALLPHEREKCRDFSMKKYPLC